MRRLPLLAASLLLLAGTCAVHDARVATRDQFATRAAVALIDGYRAHASHTMSRFVLCRFQPTCSRYGLASVKKHGAWKGGAKALSRVARCNPLTPVGTVDEP
jgi:putative membrane protein insertion efficiency factor